MACQMLRAQLLASYPNLQLKRTDPAVMPEARKDVGSDWFANEIVSLSTDGAKPQTFDVVRSLKSCSMLILI